jgi:hypothetical protein
VGRICFSPLPIAVCSVVILGFTFHVVGSQGNRFQFLHNSIENEYIRKGVETMSEDKTKKKSREVLEGVEKYLLILRKRVAIRKLKVLHKEMRRKLKEKHPWWSREFDGQKEEEK